MTICANLCAIMTSERVFTSVNFNVDDGQGYFLYPNAITCKLKWLKVDKMKNHFRIYGMWIAKINGNKMRTLPHTHFLKTKQFRHH